MRAYESIFKTEILKATNADGAQIMNTEGSYNGVCENAFGNPRLIALRNWQFHIEVSDASTGAAATPTAGTLEIAFKTPGANRAIAATTGIDLTQGDQIFTSEQPVLAEEIVITPSGLDADKVFSVYAVAS
jgi:hypothetical protein